MSVFLFIIGFEWVMIEFCWFEGFIKFCVCNVDVIVVVGLNFV